MKLWPAVIGFLLLELEVRGASRLRSTKEIVSDVQRDHPEIFYNTVELGTLAGYRTETHRVHTEDGFELAVHRILPRAQQKRGPALLMHGLLCTSDLWLLLGPRSGLAYLLADRGYDVWLGNVRGNRYGMVHERLSPEDASFWYFSWHEMGLFDLPAIVDHVLNTTGQSQLQYVGHSMGNTMLYVMLASKPQYNARVRLAVALAPVAFIHRLRVSGVEALMPFARRLMTMTHDAQMVRLAAADKTMAAMLYINCADGMANQWICARMYMEIYGTDYEGLNKTALPFYLSHLFGGASLDTLIHYLQTVNTGRFEAMDRGPEMNLRRYGQVKPPQYDLKRISAPVALYYSDNDRELHPEGVKILNKELPNVVAIFKVKDSHFNHIDFVLHSKAKSELYDAVMSLMDKYSST